MATIIDTATEARGKLKDPQKFWAYCALDSMMTAEVLAEIEPHLTHKPTRIADGTLRAFEAETYEFSRTMQAPVADMMRKGLLVDDFTRGKMIASLSAERAKLEGRLKRWLLEALELNPNEHAFLREFNHRSNAPGGHLQQLFYTVFGLPPIMAHNGKPTTDRDALERLSRYPIAQPICKMILALRDIEKTLGTLRTEIDTDGHIRTTLSIAGTNTGRMASYTASNGKGTNLQNLDPTLRHIFCAKPRRKYAYIDLEQAESRLVGAIEFVLFGDPTYLDACESDDLHTSVARMVWPHITNREQAEETYVRNFSYRFMCKRIGHGSNYVGTPRTISQETSVPIANVSDFQDKYFSAFPAHRQWHHWVAQQLATQGFLVSLMGRKRWFMGRHDDDATLREAVAFDPQSSIADLLNRGLFRLWWRQVTDPGNYPVDVLLQVHDAALVEYDDNADEEILLPKLLSAIETPITLKHKDQTRILRIPSEAKIGWNWGDWSQDNPDGLRKWTPKKLDQRRRQGDPQGSVLDRRIL